MALDPRRLLSYPVPEVRQTYTAQQSAFYALSVGMGQDPMDRRQLEFVDPNRGEAQRVLPSMALTLGYPGFWLSRDDTTADPTRLLHGEQRIEWHRPLPVSAAVVGSTRVLRLIDRGAGRHGVLVSERRIIDAASGIPYATLTQVHVLVGQGGFGGDGTPLPAPHTVPCQPPDEVVDILSRPEQALLYRLNGDFFALHSDPAMAQRSGFARPPLHGMCVAGMLTHALLRVLADYDPVRLQAIALRFSSPVYPGDTLRLEIWRDGSFRARVRTSDVVVVDNGLLQVR